MSIMLTSKARPGDLTSRIGDAHLFEDGSAALDGEPGHGCLPATVNANSKEMALSQQHNILVADDEQDIREVLRLYLENAGYRVFEAADGEETLEVLASRQVDLCLLDIMMPKLDGYQVLKQLRTTSNIPVIVISAKGQDPEKILGLDLGADDYMVKPFNPLEAVARVRSNLRRVHAFDADGRSDATSSGALQLHVRNLMLDTESCQLYRDGQSIELTPIEYRIMTLLMEHPGRVFTKQQIYECGWGEEYIAYDNSVMVCISKLRAKLSTDQGAYITTIRGIGYRLEK